MIPPYRFATAILLALCLSFSLVVAGKTTPRPVDDDGRAIFTTARILQSDVATWDRLSDLGFALQRTSNGQIIAYLSAEEIVKLASLGLAWRPTTDPHQLAHAGHDEPSPDLTYSNHAAVTARLNQVIADHPAITRLESAGNSVQGRELWFLRITDNPDTEEDEPGFKYISTMHGDEAIGVEMCLELIDYLTDNYGSDPRVTRMVDEIEIWVMPLMNPDGNLTIQRFNAGGVDLNRDFPDAYDDPTDSPAGRAPETQALMSWQYAHTTSLSANFHSGATVVNYPWDNNSAGNSVYTATPDDDICIDLSLDYSEENAPMFNGSFPQGITNGADWYAVSGGMQDWNYEWHGDIQVTVELYDIKRPAESVLEGLWNDNRDSMLDFLDRALTGVRGIVTDADNGQPLAATLSIVGRDKNFYTDPEVGDYHRAITAGTFDLRVTAPGYQEQIVPFTVADSRADAVRVDVALTPQLTDLIYDGNRLDADGGGDGWLDPGENGTLAVTLENLGDTATGIQGNLIPAGAYSTITGAGATWPDLDPGSSAESAAPHMTLAVDPAAPAGHKLAFAIDWSAGGELSGTTEAFFVPLEAPTTALEPSADVPTSIQDFQTTESTLVVTEDREIAEVNVRVDITHSYKGDVTVTLISPSGKEIRLHDRTGGSANNINTWYDTETNPVDSLDVLIGDSTAGTWTLRMFDGFNGDQGTLDGWSLELITRAYEDPVAPVRLRRVERQGSDTVLDWWPVGSATSYKVYRSLDPSAEAFFNDVTATDGDATDTSFVDGTAVAPGQVLYWIVSGEGYSGEGLWEHFAR